MRTLAENGNRPNRVKAFLLGSAVFLGASPPASAQESVLPFTVEFDSGSLRGEVFSGTITFQTPPEALFTGTLPEADFLAFSILRADGAETDLLPDAVELILPFEAGRVATDAAQFRFESEASGEFGDRFVAIFQLDGEQATSTTLVNEERIQESSGAVRFLPIAPPPDPTAPILNVRWIADAGFVELSWQGAAALETAGSPLGPWTPVPNATSPHRESPAANGAFYRLR